MFAIFPDDRPFSIGSLGLGGNASRFACNWETRGLLERPRRGIIRATNANWVTTCRDVVSEFPRIDSILGVPGDLACLASLPHSKYGPERHTGPGQPNRVKAHQALEKVGWIYNDPGNFLYLGDLPKSISKLISIYRQLHETPMADGLGLCIHQYGVESAWVAQSGFAYYGPRSLSAMDNLMLRTRAALQLPAGVNFHGQQLPESLLREWISTITFSDLQSNLALTWFRFYGLEALRALLRRFSHDLTLRATPTDIARPAAEHLTWDEIQRRGLVYAS